MALAAQDWSPVKVQCTENTPENFLSDQESEKGGFKVMLPLEGSVPDSPSPDSLPAEERPQVSITTPAEQELESPPAVDEESDKALELANKLIVEEKPVEEKPVEEKPVEEKPVEEKPVEEEEAVIRDDDHGTTTDAKGGSLSSWSVSAMAENPATPNDVLIAQSEEGKKDPPHEVEPISGKPPTAVYSWLMETVEAAVPLPVPKVASASVDCLAIDPETGNYIPIEHPDCKPDYDLQSEPAWRRSNLTSDMQISREVRVRQRLAQRIKERFPIPTVPEEESAFPRADCMIRPATDDDIAGILGIVNLEREKVGLDGDSGSPSIKWKNIAGYLSQCKEEYWPFIIAVCEDELLDRSKWPAKSDNAYRAYVAYRDSAKPKAIVVGFAFARRRKPSGLELDFYNGRVDESCNITLFVHPDHRNKKYGSALLDRILMSVSPVHRSLIDFGWKCDDSAKIYEPLAANNAQQYARVFVEYEKCVENECQAASPAEKLLKKFGFAQVGHLHCVRSQVHEGRRLWCDLCTWELEAQSLEDVRR